jgi:hypothetical protein
MNRWELGYFVDDRGKSARLAELMCVRYRT